MNRGVNTDVGANHTCHPLVAPVAVKLFSQWRKYGASSANWENLLLDRSADLPVVEAHIPDFEDLGAMAGGNQRRRPEGVVVVATRQTAHQRIAVGMARATSHRQRVVAVATSTQTSSADT